MAPKLLDADLIRRIRLVKLHEQSTKQLVTWCVALGHNGYGTRNQFYTWLQALIWQQRFDLFEPPQSRQHYYPTNEAEVLDLLETLAESGGAPPRPIRKWQGRWGRHTRKS